MEIENPSFITGVAAGIAGSYLWSRFRSSPNSPQYTQDCLSWFRRIIFEKIKLTDCIIKVVLGDPNYPTVRTIEQVELYPFIDFLVLNQESITVIEIIPKNLLGNPSRSYKIDRDLKEPIMSYPQDGTQATGSVTDLSWAQVASEQEGYNNSPHGQGHLGPQPQYTQFPGYQLVPSNIVYPVTPHQQPTIIRPQIVEYNPTQQLIPSEPQSIKSTAEGNPSQGGKPEKQKKERIKPTIPCRSYATANFCPFGTTCKYLHEYTTKYSIIGLQMSLDSIIGSQVTLGQALKRMIDIQRDQLGKINKIIQKVDYNIKEIENHIHRLNTDIKNLGVSSHNVSHRSRDRQRARSSDRGRSSINDRAGYYNSRAR